jgi:hypothetical protein
MYQIAKWKKWRKRLYPGGCESGRGFNPKRCWRLRNLSMYEAAKSEPEICVQETTRNNTSQSLTINELDILFRPFISMSDEWKKTNHWQISRLKCFVWIWLKKYKQTHNQSVVNVHSELVSHLSGNLPRFSFVSLIAWRFFSSLSM